MGHKIITIGRQYGSGGHEIGEKLAKLLNIPLYDKNLVERAAKELGITEGDTQGIDENVLTEVFAVNAAPWSTAYHMVEDGRPLSDQLYRVQSDIIKTLAGRGPCVIVGRCADYVLRNNPDCINVFICASKEDRIKRIARIYEMTEKEAASRIKKVDRKRRLYYENYTEQDWGSINSHQLLMNVSKLGEDRIIQILKTLYEA